MTHGSKSVPPLRVLSSQRDGTSYLCNFDSLSLTCRKMRNSTFCLRDVALERDTKAADCSLQDDITHLWFV